MNENFVDFRTVKQVATMKSVLDHYGVRLRNSNQHSLRGKCPLPTHSSGKSNESFSVQTAKNIWACQSTSCASARQGKKGGNVIDFVAAMERCTIRDAALKLHEWFGTSTNVAQARTETASTKSGGESAPKKDIENAKGENKPLTFILKAVDSSHVYLRQRGIKEEIARHFGVGYFAGRGSMSGRVVIPIHNNKSELVAYAGRAIDGTEPKYKLPTGFFKSCELFNLYRAVLAKRNVLIVVEGFFDCMKVHQAGFANVVALMGSTLSEEQQKLITTFSQVVLFLDGDEAGREGAKAIAARLVHSHFVKVVSLVGGKQPDQLSSEEIRILLGSL